MAFDHGRLVGKGLCINSHRITDLQHFCVHGRQDRFAGRIGGEIDTFLAPDYQADFEITSNGLRPFVAKAKYSHHKPFKANYFMMSKKSVFQKEKDAFESEIAGMHKDGTIDRLTEEFMQKYKVPFNF